VEALLPGFRGRVTQVPPSYSAIKVGGRRAYALARAGQAVEMRSREVEIDRLEIVDWDGSDPERPVAIVEVDCSAGTYIRALARDIGAAVGSGAYLGALTRTASGPFTLEDGVPLDDIRAAAGEGSPGLASLLRPVESGLELLPVATLAAEEVAAFARGQHVTPAAGVPRSETAGTPIRVVGPDGELLGIAHAAGSRLAPDKVLVDPNPTRG
jgi:tRNA pseudouridine55 synthase